MVRNKINRLKSITIFMSLDSDFQMIHTLLGLTMLSETYEDANLTIHLQVACIIMKKSEAIIYRLIILGSELNKLSNIWNLLFLFFSKNKKSSRIPTLRWSLHPPWGVDAGHWGSPGAIFFGVGRRESSPPWADSLLSSAACVTERFCILSFGPHINPAFIFNHGHLKAQRNFQVGSSHSDRGKPKLEERRAMLLPRQQVGGQPGQTGVA